MNIAIKSKRKLPFDIVQRIEGFIKVEIDLYQRTKNGWYLRIVDTCTYGEESVEVQPNPENPEEMIQVPVMVEKTQSITREKVYPAEFLNGLALAVNAKKILKNETFAEDLDKLFKVGLLALTQKECLDGKGIYLSNAEDWELCECENE